MAGQLPPLPRQVQANVYTIFLNGVRQVKGEAGAIGVLFDFPAPLNRIVCRTLPITPLLSSYSAKQVTAWEVQIAILMERSKAQALRRNHNGVLLSTSPETLVLDGPWHAQHDTPEELISRQMQIRTGFHKTLLRTKSRGGEAINPSIATDGLNALLKQRFGLLKIIESEENWQVWQGKKQLIGILEPAHCKSAEILQAAIRLDEISDQRQKQLLVVCNDAEAIMHDGRLLERLMRFDISMLAAESRDQLGKALNN